MFIMTSLTIGLLQFVQIQIAFYLIIALTCKHVTLGSNLISAAAPINYTWYTNYTNQQ